MKRAKKLFLASLFYSKFFLLIGLVALIFIFIELGQVLVRKKEINNEIASLQKEIADLQGKNRDIKELLGYFKTSSFTEEEARLKLGLVKEGEQAVIIPQTATGGEQNSINNKVPTNTIIISNPRRWWNYFFKNNQNL